MRALPYPAIHLALVLALVGPIAAGCSGSGEGPPSDQARAAVEVAPAQVRDVPERYEFLGTVEAVQRVELRARVTGYITSVGFEEGAVVDADQVLYEIDTRPLRASQRSASASVRRTKAQLDEARRQLAREEKLRAADVNSEQDVQTAQAEVDALEGEIAAQRANLQQAKLDVGYSKIRAPFRGRIGERLADVGELVGEGVSTLLAVVIQEDPVFVRFSPAERERRAMLALEPALEELGGDEVAVTLTLSDASSYPETGRLAFVDNVVDTATRALTYKAVFPNAEKTLKPGESVVAHIDLEAGERVVIPAVAVASVQDVDYVYVVDESAVAHYREVELGSTIEGLRIVHEGLEAGEKVITRGLQRVADGATVEVRETDPGRG